MKPQLRINKTFILLLLIAFMGLHLSKASGIKFNHIKLEEAKKLAAKENKFIFVDVYATWCGPCKYLTREVFTKKELGNYFNEHFVSVKIDGEKGEGPDVMQKFSVDAYPTLLFISAEGELVKKKVGAMGAEDLLKVAKEIVDPSSSPLYKLGQEFKKGKREKAFMKKYFRALMEDEQEEKATTVAKEYLSTYKDMDLKDEDEFMIFLVAENDVDSPLMKDYIKNNLEYESVHGISYWSKFYFTMSLYIEETAKTKDKGRLLEVFEKLWKGFDGHDDTEDKEEMKSAIVEAYEDEVGPEE